MVHMSDVFYDFVRRGNLKRVRASNAEIDRYAVTSDDLLIARLFASNYSGAAKPCLVSTLRRAPPVRIFTDQVQAQRGPCSD